jgi:hypothetical protein
VSADLTNVGARLSGGLDKMGASITGAAAAVGASVAATADKASASTSSAAVDVKAAVPSVSATLPSVSAPTFTLPKIEGVDLSGLEKAFGDIKAKLSPHDFEKLSVQFKGIGTPDFKMPDLATLKASLPAGFDMKALETSLSGLKLPSVSVPSSVSVTAAKVPEVAAAAVAAVGAAGVAAVSKAGAQIPQGSDVIPVASGAAFSNLTRVPSSIADPSAPYLKYIGKVGLIWSFDLFFDVLIARLFTGTHGHPPLRRNQDLRADRNRRRRHQAQRNQQGPLGKRHQRQDRHYRVVPSDHFCSGRRCRQGRRDWRCPQGQGCQGCKEGCFQVSRQGPEGLRQEIR